MAYNGVNFSMFSTSVIFHSYRNTAFSQSKLMLLKCYFIIVNVFFSPLCGFSCLRIPLRPRRGLCIYIYIYIYIYIFQKILIIHKDKRERNAFNESLYVVETRLPFSINFLLHFTAHTGSIFKVFFFFKVFTK